MSFLNTIKKAISGSATTQGHSVLGVDIGSSTIKVVQLRRERGKAVLETYGEIALGPYASVEIGRKTKLDASSISQALVDVIKESNVTARTAGLAVPFASSLTSIFEMPPLSKDQLEQMVPIEARKYIPVPINEVTMDWFVIPQSQETLEESKVTKQEILLVAIRNEIIDKYQSIAGAAKIDVSFYELEIFSVARSTLGHGIAPVMIVDIGASTTKVYVVERGIIRISHLINLGSQDMTLSIVHALGWNFEKAERVKRERGLSILAEDEMQNGSHVKDALLSTLGRIFSDINRVLLSYGKKYNKNIAKIVLTGGGAEMRGLLEESNKQLETSVELADPFEKIETPVFLEEVLEEVGPEFSVAIGVALRLM